MVVLKRGLSTTNSTHFTHVVMSWLLASLHITVRANGRRQDPSEEERIEEELHDGDSELYYLNCFLFLRQFIL
jgi:hypothetical protein